MRNSIWSFVVVEVERSSDGGMVVRNWGGAASLIDVRTRMRAGMRYVAECGEGRIERAEPSSLESTRCKMILESVTCLSHTSSPSHNYHTHQPPNHFMYVTLYGDRHIRTFSPQKRREKRIPSSTTSNVDPFFTVNLAFPPLNRRTTSFFCGEILDMYDGVLSRLE